MEDEYSQGGSKIYRHEHHKNEGFVAADSEDCSMDEIVEHIERYVGKPETVLHEIVSEYVHIDVHVVAPTPEQNFITLVTSGMSDKPMETTFEGTEYSELLICLPPDWKLSQGDFQDPRNYWVVEWLKMLARFPHVANTWLWETHTVPNGDPPEPFAANTKTCCMLVAPPVLFDREFRTLKVREDKIIHFHSLIPIYREEMNLKLERGVDALYGKFANGGVSELLDINRKNTCRKWFGIF